MRGDVEWTNLSRKEVAERMGAPGTPVRRDVASQLLRRQGYRRRKALKKTTMGRHRDRNARFEKIGRLKKYLEAGSPVISIDTKKKFADVHAPTSRTVVPSAGRTPPRGPAENDCRRWPPPSSPSRRSTRFHNPDHRTDGARRAGRVDAAPRGAAPAFPGARARPRHPRRRTRGVRLPRGRTVRPSPAHNRLSAPPAPPPTGRSAVAWESVCLPLF
jgi:hypothetical protein